MISRQFIVNIKTQMFKILDNFQLFSIDYYWVEGSWFALNEILNSLHLSGLSCILFSIGHIDTESAIFWALLIEVSVQFLKLLNHRYTSKSLLVLL